MKFAKVLQQTLIEEDLPEQWVEAAIQYKALKKYIGKVVEELRFLGLTNTDMKLIMQNSSENKTVEVDDEEAIATNPIVAQYTIAKTRDNKKLVAFLKVKLNPDSYGDGVSPNIQELATQIQARIEGVLSTDEDEPHIVEITEQDEHLVLSPTVSHRDKESIVEVNNQNEIIIMLKSDSKFFGMLNSELESLDKIRRIEEEKLMKQIELISGKVLSLTTRKKSDLSNWRELFKIYLDSEIFFRYNDTAHVSMELSSPKVRQNLDDFKIRVAKTQLVSQFDKKRSLVAYEEFVELNEHLFKVLQFQSINTMALRKILKKFDKRTSLNASVQFPDLISEDHIFINGASLAQSLCYVLQNKLLILAPQIDDYSCPICTSIAYKPIRLCCQHVFCVRCLVKMKQRGKTDCPLCREQGAINAADSSNLDLQLMQYMQKYFPAEIKEKIKEVEKEKYDEVITHKHCNIV